LDWPRRKHDALIAEGDAVEIEAGEKRSLRQHQGYDQECNAIGPQDRKPRRERNGKTGNDAASQGSCRTEAEPKRRQSRSVSAGCKKHRMPEAQKARIAEQHIISDGKNRIDHDACGIHAVIGRQRELQHEKENDDRRM
jgi:hypothetical protein